jgi:hypothetical protein
MTQPRSRPNAPRQLPVPWPILLLLVLAVGAVAYSAFAPPALAAEHPHPRAGVTAERVQPPARYAADPRVAQVYAEVAEIAEVVDGIYCYCRCEEHSGHYSLLTCFESDHGAGCGTCLGQAHLAYTMTQQGASLDQIRQAVDQQFGR